MAPEFWKFIHSSIGSHVSRTDGSLDFHIPVTGFGMPPQAIGKFFLRYAYSTPAGVAYRLTYGVPKP